MIELVFAFLIVLFLVAVSLLGTAMSGDTLLSVGFVVAVAGLLIGVPTGLLYHVRLRRALMRKGGVQSRWWLFPTAFHGRLDPELRASVMPWFYAGATAFFISVVGCVIAALGALRELK
ncbi:MAG: hypothetical protein HY698_08890 [Deltaproteobacteria bacterium]|nr:hypothetical protein [Deltaproteobacteria bacterium]